MIDYTFPKNCQIPGLSDIYNKYFPAPGMFCEVGAFNGYDFSNTWGLIEAGWKGLLIEPNPHNFQKLHTRYVNNTNVFLSAAAVAPERFANIRIDGKLSTTKDDQYQAFVDAGWTNGQAEIMTVVAAPLDVLLARWTVIPPDLIVIDVEGAELDVLSTFTVRYWLPTMVIIEACEGHEIKALAKNADAINRYFLEAGYKKIYSDQINNIYVLC